METSTGIRVASVPDATLRVDNLGDASRLHDLRAEVSFHDGRCKCVREGTVTEPGAEGHIASFQTYNPTSGELGITFNTKSGRGAIMGEVEDFLTAAVSLDPLSLMSGAAGTETAEEAE